MSLSPAEREAVAKDIRQGVTQVIARLKEFEQVMPIAIQPLAPHATSTRKMLLAVNRLSDARRAFEDVLNWELSINGGTKP